MSVHEADAHNAPAIAGTRTQSSDATRIAHIAIILVGAAALAIVAHYDAIWFDESYSIAIAQHPFAEIVEIGSSDVHPVLYYCLLRVVFLVFGQNVYAFRLVSVVGTIALSLLGYTHVRKDLGRACGMVFSALVYLIPWSVHIALQIRMYSWTAFAVLLAAIYAWRIIRETQSDAPARIPAHWWAALTLASACAAYLHYYGAMAAFCVQLIVIVAIALQPNGRKRNVAIWGICAAIAVALFMPWLLIAFGQASTVSQGFWIDFSYPDSFASFASYPFGTDDTLRLRYFEIGSTTLNDVVFFLFLFAILCSLLCAYDYGKGVATRHEADNRYKGFKRMSPALFFFLVFAGTASIAGILSEAIQQPILHVRYISAGLGALMLAVAYVLSHLTSKTLRAVTAVLIIALGICAYWGAWLGGNNPQNQEAIDAYAQTYERAMELNEGTEPYVFASDEGTTATVAMSSDLDVPIMFLRGDKKYRAYEPRYVVGADADELLESYEGTIVFIGERGDVRNFVREHDARIIEYTEKFHPYSGRNLGYCLISCE